MTEQEFTIQMNRLAETFGKSAYSSERVKLIWSAVRDFSQQWWGSTVNYFIGYQKQAPLMSEIGEAVGKERERIWNQQKKNQAPIWQPEKNASCVGCRDSGVVLARELETKAIYAFLCNCDAGKADRRNYPRWNFRSEDYFEVAS